MSRRPVKRRRWAPTRAQLQSNRYLRPVAHQLGEPWLWRLTRKAVARGVAVGIFAGFILPLGQIVLAVLMAVPLRANVVVAAGATLVTNPITLPFIYYAAFEVGDRLIRYSRPVGSIDPGAAQTSWLASVTLPTSVGLLLFAITGAVTGYAVVRGGWRLWIAWQWQQRRRRRSP